MECTLTSEELGVRGQRWCGLGAADVAETEYGLRLTFPVTVEDELRELAELERGCCAFARWEVTRQGDSAVLDVSADGEAVGAVQSLFGSLRK